MITHDYDKSVSKKQESGLKWLIIFLGKVCMCIIKMTESAESLTHLLGSESIRIFSELNHDGIPSSK